MASPSQNTYSTGGSQGQGMPNGSPFGGDTSLFSHLNPAILSLLQARQGGQPQGTMTPLGEGMPNGAPHAPTGEMQPFHGGPIGQIMPNWNMTEQPNWAEHMPLEAGPMEMGKTPPQGNPNESLFAGGQPFGVPQSGSPTTTNYAGSAPFNMPKNNPQPAQPGSPWLGNIFSSQPPSSQPAGKPIGGNGAAYG